MIKIGDRIRGFSFEDSDRLEYHINMRWFEGVEGEVVALEAEKFNLRFQCADIVINEQMPAHFLWSMSKRTTITWYYPIADYLKIQREERLKELEI